MYNAVVSQEARQRRWEPWRWGEQWLVIGSWQRPTERITEADPLTTTQEVAEELNVDHSIVVRRLKQTEIVKGFPGGASCKEPTCQCRRQETHIQSLGPEDPLEDSMATHSNIFAWRVPWTEELGRLQSIVSQRVGCDWIDSAHTHARLCKAPRIGTRTSKWKL